MSFGAAGLALDGWSHADIDCGGEMVILSVVVEAGEPGVDAVGGEHGLGVEVDGRDVDGAPELLALLDGADEFVRATEDIVYISDSALLEEPAGHG